MKYLYFVSLLPVSFIGCSSDLNINENYTRNVDTEALTQWRPLTYTIFETDFSGSNGKPLKNVEVTVFNDHDEFVTFYRELHDNEDSIRNNLKAIDRLTEREGIKESYFASHKEALERALKLSGNLDFINLDFENGSVLFIDLGKKSSTGYGAHIDSIERYGDGIHLLLNHLSPGEGCIVGASMTRPYVLAYVHNKVHSIEVQSKKYIEEC